MELTITNTSADPKLAMAMLQCMPIREWQQLLDALAPLKLPGGVELLSVCFDERLPRTHFDQRRRGMFHLITTGIDKPHYLTAATTELRDYLLDFVAESLERADWSAEIRQQASDIFRSWRGALPREIQVS